MFDEINGLPVHALVVHAAVVLVPLAALLGVLFVVPYTRAWSRTPLLLVSLGAAASVYVSRESGFKLQEALGLNSGNADPRVALIVEHQKRADLLLQVTLAFAAVAVVAFVLSRRPSSFEGPVALVVMALLVIGAAGVAFQTYRVGDIGARAVWNPTGKTSFSETKTGE